jgi:hypothetical protein
MACCSQTTSKSLRERKFFWTVIKGKYCGVFPLFFLVDKQFPSAMENTISTRLIQPANQTLPCAWIDSGYWEDLHRFFAVDSD